MISWCLGHIATEETQVTTHADVSHHVRQSIYVFLGDGNDRWSYSVNRGSYDIVSCDLFFYVYIYIEREREKKHVCMYVYIYIYMAWVYKYISIYV